MNKLQWQEVDENKKYNVYLNENFIGIMNRDSETGSWALQLPDYNICKVDQYRNDLMEYAENKLCRKGLI